MGSKSTVPYMERLKRSAQLRSTVVRKFGFVPSSVVNLGGKGSAKQYYRYQLQRPDLGRHKNKPTRELKESMEAELGGTIKSPIKSGEEGASSIMPVATVEFFCKFYAAAGDVYLDPFMGHGIQMQVAKRLGMDYYGYDLCGEFCRFIKGVAGKIDDGKTKLVVVEGDSCYPTQIPDGIGDFCFTSPPYWDVEWYGDEQAQLGQGSYKGFIKEMGAVGLAWLPKFKKGAYVVVNVGDIRKDGVFYPYHADLISEFVRVGYTFADIWILQGLANMWRMYAVSYVNAKRCPKSHEYALVFRV